MLPKTVRSAFFFTLPLPIRIVASTLLASLIASPLGLRAQTASAASSAIGSNGTAVVPSRLTSRIVESSRVTLSGNVHALATKANDRGQIADSMKLERIQIVLKRSETQEAGLKRLLTDLHSPGSTSYHKWLTPATFGAQFGPSDADVATLETWLQSRGFTVTKLAPGRQVLEITGTAGQLRNTFRTEMHQYAVDGAIRYANATAPEIPAALAPVFGGFVSLNNFRYRHDAKILGKAQLNAATHETKPEWTTGSANAFSLILAPADFAVQYDLNPLYSAGTNGAGQTIAIVNESNINVAQVNNYRTLFGLPANPPQVIIDGSDPGVDGINSPLGPNNFSGEAYLDVELAGAVAPNAQIDLVIANDTATANGLTLAMEHAVYSNIAPVVSVSFGRCEEDRGTLNGFVESLWEQAAAQGQTVLVSTGDNGSAGCDVGTEYAVRGQAVNGLASTPYNIAVGGTDFYYTGDKRNISTYWNTTPTNDTPTVSLKSPVPEQPWNNSQFGFNLIPFDSSGATSTIEAGSGGPSTLGKVSGTSQSPTFGPYPKPSWQTGAGVPADGARDLPDISLFAANGQNGSYYPICAGDADCQAVANGQQIQITGIGGTSASTPAFAGMMALINQKYGRQGQANYILYPLAAQFPATFHDVTVGTIAVPCATTTVFDSYDSNQAIAPKDCATLNGGFTVTDSRYGQTTEGELSVDGTNASYDATAGYDLATGLGTVDANNLVTNWGKFTLAATTTTLTPSTTSFAHGTAVGFTGKVTGSGTPTGDVALVTTSTDVNNQGQATFALDGSGLYTGQVSYLPGGNYNVYGYYAGDGVNGPSSSNPVALTVTPEASATTLNVYTSINPTTQVSTTPVSYGAPNILSAQAGPTTGNATTAPTGSVDFLDGSTVVNTAVVNVNGDAQYNGAFAVGSHTIKAKYSGDGSYGASTSSPVSFTVAKNDPNILVFESNQNSNGDPINGQTTYLAVQIENSASVNGLALAPSGTVTVSGLPSGTNSSTTLVPGIDPFNKSPQGTGYFAVPASASGPYTATFVYSGDNNYVGYTTTPTSFNFVNGAGSVATTTTATASASSTSPTSLVTVATTVTSAGGGAPTGTIRLYASQYQIAARTLTPGSGNSSTASATFDSATLFQGTNQITVQYVPASGSNFMISAAEVTIANPLSDFSMIPVSTILNVPATGEGAGFQTDVINLTSINGFAGAVSLSCTGASGVICYLAPTPVTLTSSGSASSTLLVDTGSITTPGSYNLTVTGKNAGGTVIHTLGLTAVTTQTAAVPRFTLAATGVAIAAPGGSGTSTVTITSQNGFTGTVDLTCVISIASGPTNAPVPTCTATSASVTGTSAVTTTITISTTTSTPSGTYQANVKGDSGDAGALAPFALTVGVAGTAGFTLSGTPVTIVTTASQGATGTSTITVTPTNGFTGTVALTCAVTSAPSGATAGNYPTCSAASASVTGAGAATATLTINTTAQTAKLELPFSIEHGKSIFMAGGGAAFAAILLFGVPFGQRRRQQLRSLRGLRMLSLAVLFALAAGAAIGCGSGSTSAPPPTGGGGTTLGSYTLTVTGTSGAATATTPIVVTVN